MLIHAMGISIFALAPKGKNVIQIFADHIMQVIKRLASALSQQYEYLKDIQYGILRKSRGLSSINHRIDSKVATLFLFMSLAFCSGKAAALPFGTSLGSFNGVVAYSNGSSTYVSPTSNYVGGKYTGIQWQCVEYVRRYYLAVYGL